MRHIKGTRERTYLAVCVSAAAVIGCIAAGILTGSYMTHRYRDDIRALRDDLDSQHTIIHAAGGIMGSDGDIHTYTNCLEALQASIAAGNRYIEIDLINTADKKVICASDEEYFDITETEFMSIPVDGEFTPMNIDILAGIMRDNPEVRIITDVRNGNVAAMERISAAYPDLSDRFIVQVYHDSEYTPIRRLGYKYIIFTLYQTEEEEREPSVLERVTDKHDYVGITFWEEWMSDGNYFDALKALDVPLYVHTVDDTDCIRDDLDRGISAVYTDNTDNDWLR